MEVHGGVHSDAIQSKNTQKRFLKIGNSNNSIYYFRIIIFILDGQFNWSKVQDKSL